MRKTAFLVAFILCGISPAIPQSESVADFVKSYIQRKAIPGVAVLVRKDGKVVFSQGFGMANLELRVPVTPQTVFQSGSMGKQFTAAAVMLLIDERKMALGDPVAKYLNVPDTWNGITIRHLLTHTSGLGDYPEDFSMRLDYTEEEIFKMITAQPLAFAPGEKWSYSNLGYVTLGILIGKVSGKFYGDFLKERVFDPLQMKSTRVISEADIIPNRAAGYRMRDGAVKNQEWVSPALNTTADGSLYFTVEDLAKWDEALEARKLLSRESYGQIWTPVKLNDGSTAPYGFGWSLDTTVSGHKLVQHGGAWQGFTTHIARYPDDGVTVVVLCNMAGADPGYIAHSVAGFYKADLGPAKHNAIRIDPAVLKSYEGEYRLDDRMTVKVAVLGEALSMTFMGQKLMLIPDSPTTFFEEDSERTYRFEKDANGRVASMVVRVPEMLTFKRLPQ